MRRIPISETYETIIDEEDYPLVSRFNWKPFKTQFNIYAIASVDGSKVFLHRLITGATGRTNEVDHINCVGLDNRKSNLRLCTRVQNSHNSPVRKDNKLGLKGVYYNTRENKYYAQIKPPEVTRVFIGSFDTAKDAARAYNDAATKYFGEFARLNEI